MSLRTHILGLTAAALLAGGTVGPTTALAGNDALLGAVGGLLAGKLLSDHQQKKQAEAYQSGADDEYVAQQQQQQYAQQYSQQQQQSTNMSPQARLERLKQLKDQGLISESDYNKQVAVIVNGL
jgi:hypothetical protein